MGVWRNLNFALVAIITLLTLTFEFILFTQATTEATFKIISDQHRGPDTASVSLDLTPQHTFVNPTSTTQFDDDDDEPDYGHHRVSNDDGNTYTLSPRESSVSDKIERPPHAAAAAPKQRFFYKWPTSEPSAQQPASSGIASSRQHLSKSANSEDARLRYKVHVQRTLNSSRASTQQPDDLMPSDNVFINLPNGENKIRTEKCDRSHEQESPWRRKDMKYLNVSTKQQNAALEPILLTSDVKVLSDLVLVRDQEVGGGPASGGITNDGDPIKHTSYDNRLDLLGSLPIKTLSQRVKVVLPHSYRNKNFSPGGEHEARDDQNDENKLFILREVGLEPNSIKQQLNEQIKSSLIDEAEGFVPTEGNKIELEMDDLSPIEELTRAADTRSSLVKIQKPPSPPLARLTVKRKYGLSFSNQMLASNTGPLEQELRSAPASTSSIRVTVGNGTRPVVVNSRGLITAVKKHHTFGGVDRATSSNNTATRPYNPMQLFASSQTSQTLNPIESTTTTMNAIGKLPESVLKMKKNKTKYKPGASMIIKRPSAPAAATIEHGPVDHSHHTDTSYTLAPMSSTTTIDVDRAHQSTTSGSQLFGSNFNQTTTTTTTTTSASGNFHHNPPYQQHHSSTTVSFVSTTPPPTPTPKRVNNRFQSGAAATATATANPAASQQQHNYHHQHSVPPATSISGHTRGNRNQTSDAQKRPSQSPYEGSATSDLLSEPANTLQIDHKPILGPSHNSASAPSLNHLQQTLAISSLKPTKIRIKLFNSLFRGAKPHNKTSAPLGGNSHAANQTSSTLDSVMRPTPHLLSSTVANNVAALVAQKLTTLVRPPSLPTSVSGGGASHHSLSHLSNLFGFRVGPQTTSLSSSLGQSFSSHRLKHPFAGTSQASAPPPPNLGINRRTTGVGSLLVSGLIYGLTVLPALMALTGINPLSADSPGGSLNSMAPLVANRQQQQQHQHQQAQTGEKRSKQAKSTTTTMTRNRPSRDIGHHSMLSDSATDAFAYLLPVVSSPAAIGTLQSEANQLASAVESLRHSPAGGLDMSVGQHEAQSSALKSLYAPPPTVLEPFSGNADFSGLLEDQPSNEIEWPTTTGAAYMQANDNQERAQQLADYQRLGQTESSWAISSDRDNSAPRPSGSFVRRNRDLPNEWPTTIGGGDVDRGNTGNARNKLRPDYVMGSSSLVAARATTTTTPPPSFASFDDRSAIASGTSFQSQQASRQVSQVALPPPQPPPPLAMHQRQQPNHDAINSVAQLGSSVGMLAPIRSAHDEAAQQVAQLDRFRQQVEYLVNSAQEQQMRHRQQPHQQQQQVAQLGYTDSDFAILGPYRPPPLSLGHTATSVDLGGPRQRRAPVVRMPTMPPPTTQTATNSHLMNLTTNERPGQHDSWTTTTRRTLADKSRHPGDKLMGILSPDELRQPNNRTAATLRAPSWAGESDWRAIGAPVLPGSRSPSSSLRHNDDRLFYGSHWERSAIGGGSGGAGVKKKTNKSKSKKSSSKRKRLPSLRSTNINNKSQSTMANSTTTSAPAVEKINVEESELIMAHSMATGSRVLNEQLATGSHQ